MEETGEMICVHQVQEMAEVVLVALEEVEEGVAVEPEEEVEDVTLAQVT